GTRTRSAADIADALDGRGASLSVVAGRHQVMVSATCLAEDFRTICSLVADIIQRPAFDEREVTTRRGDLLTSILQDEDDPAAVAVDSLMARLYPDHPYGRRARGTAATVEQLWRADLIEFHSKWFTPETAILAVVGDVNPEDAVVTASEEFESWNMNRAIEPVLSAPSPPRARELSVVPMMSKAQADVAYGFLGLRRSDPDYYAGWVMNNALGQYALGGRLGDSIRERQGMAYYVYSTLDASLAEGPMMIRAGVAAENVQRTLSTIDKELESLLSDGVSVKEFDESKRYLIGSIPRQLETNASIAGFLLSSEFYELGIDYDARLPALISDVTLEDVNAVARRLIDPQKAVVVVAGPWQGPNTGEAMILSVSHPSAAPAVSQSKDLL
ncbi:MAG TPA: pitrilysin family protein, partial [Vicinamibacterales bacterium]|nr:pitrilysin family protein [Vicinamibacterales bacterium]